MRLEIECNQIDLRYESYRMRNDAVEKRLLFSIERHGIHTALQAIRSKEEQRVVLLDGFKRNRVARKLGLSQLPVEIVADDYVPGFLILLRNGSQSPLTVLEQASFLRDLHTEFHLTFSEISRRVERSLSWVSVRINLINTMKEELRKKIVAGKFPLRSYMYTLAPFTRVKGRSADVQQFIDVTSGKDYSTRDIETLSRAFFGDDPKVKEHILSGNTDWTLQMLKKEPYPGSDATESDKIYHALKSCRWHTAEILRHYRRSPEIFIERRNAEIFDFVSTNCKAISALEVKEKCIDYQR